MNRRQFFELGRKVTLGVLATSLLPGPDQPIAISVDVATEGPDTTFVGLHGTYAAMSDDLGGFLVPQGYVKEVLATINSEEQSYQRHKPADLNLLADNFKRVHQDFAQFLKEVAA